MNFNGRESASKRRRIAKIRLNHMGFIFQDINLLKNLSVIDNVMFPALVSKVADKKAVIKKQKNIGNDRN